MQSPNTDFRDKIAPIFVLSQNTLTGVKTRLSPPSWRLNLCAKTSLIQPQVAAPELLASKAKTPTY